MTGLLQGMRKAALRNRPSLKPQLWEDFSLALRRRLNFEISRRIEPDWLDHPRVIALSNNGFRDELPPLRMEVVPREMMNQALFLYGTFEISETRLIQAFLAPGMTFIDVGANIGYYTLIAARVVGPDGVVHAFEPNPAMRERLADNLRRNRLENVHVRPEAVAQETGRVRFYQSTLEENQGISSILPGSGRQEVAEVPSVSLDDFVASLGGRRIDLIKIDIEGAEAQLIAGGRQTLSASDAPPLIFEAFDLPPIESALRAFGYQVRSLNYTLRDGLELPGTEERRRSLFEDYEAPNYFAAKDSSIFTDILSRANAARSTALRFLGRL